MPCMSGAAGNWGAKAAPPPARSTARASEAPEKGACSDPHGHGAGKKINGKKRHVMVDTQGLPMRAVVHPAKVQGRGGGAPPVSTPFGPYPFLRKLFAGGGYQGPRFEQAVARVLAPVNVEAVKRPGTAKGFAVLPRRWVVGRTFAWLNRCRRPAKDFGNRSRTALAFLKPASVRLMTRRLCNP